MRCPLALAWLKPGISVFSDTPRRWLLFVLFHPGRPCSPAPVMLAEGWLRAEDGAGWGGFGIPGACSCGLRGCSVSPAVLHASFFSLV